MSIIKFKQKLTTLWGLIRYVLFAWLWSGFILSSQLQLHIPVHCSPVLLQEQRLQVPLHAHFVRNKVSRASVMDVYIGTQIPFSSFQPQPQGDGMLECRSTHDVQRPHV